MSVKICLENKIPPILDVILLHKTVKKKQLHWVRQIMFLYMEKKKKKDKKWDKKLTSKNLHPS